MLSRLKPRDPVELPTQGGDDQFLEDIHARLDSNAKALATPGVVERGLRGSSSAILLGQGNTVEQQESGDQYKQDNPNWVRDGVESLINMAASYPVFFAGSPAGPAGSFALDTAVKAYYGRYLEAVKNGETGLSFEDWKEVAKDSGKSALLGGALSVAAPFLDKAIRNPTVGKLLRTPLSQSAAEKIVEAGAFTVGGAAIGHGDLSLEAFRDNLIAIAGFRLGDKAVKQLYTKYKKTGAAPEKLLLEYKPEKEGSVKTPITEEQRKGANKATENLVAEQAKAESKERLSSRVEEENARRREIGKEEIDLEKVISKESAPEEKRPGIKQSEEQSFEKSKKPAEQIKSKEAIESFEKGAKSFVESETKELERIEKEIKKLETQEVNQKKQQEASFVEQLKKDLQDRIKNLKKKREDVTAKEQKELYKRAQDDLKNLKYQELRQKKLEAKQKKADYQERLTKMRDKELKYAEDAARRNKLKKELEASKKRREEKAEAAELKIIEDGIKKLESQERREALEKGLFSKAKKGLTEKIQALKRKREEIKKRQLALKKQQQQQVYKNAKDIKDRFEALKQRREDIEKRTEITPKERYETEKQMNRPIAERVEEVLASEKADVKQLYTKLNKSYQAKDPRSFKEPIKKEIAKKEKFIKQLENSRTKIDKQTIQQSAEEIAKTKGNKDYVERVTKSAESMANKLLEQIEKSSTKAVANEAIKKDLKKMGIDLRCI